MMGDGIGDRTGEGAFRYGATKGTRAAHDPGCKYPGAGSSYKQFLLILQLEPLVNHSAGGGRGVCHRTTKPGPGLCWSLSCQLLHPARTKRSCREMGWKSHLGSGAVGNTSVLHL